MRPEFDAVQKKTSKTGKASIAFAPHAFVRHVIFSLAVVVGYLLLSRSEVIIASQVGFTLWYPATGLILAVMLGVSPWYFMLAVIADALAGTVIYHRPVTSWSVFAGPLLVSGTYAVAASLLRGPLKIDPQLRRRQDVLRYVSTGLAAAMVARIGRAH